MDFSARRVPDRTSLLCYYVLYWESEDELENGKSSTSMPGEVLVVRILFCSFVHELKNEAIASSAR